MRMTHHTAQRGATLIEALVAMAIMAFGMLAVVGVQGTLRINADISKQRGEATRLAEQNLEELRGFADDTAFDAIALTTAGEPATTSHDGDNTTFTIERQVTLAPDERSKMINAVVKWTDRTGEPRQVEMYDLLARVDPLLSGIVRAQRPLTPVGQHKRRHPTIPGRAKDLPGSGKSIFKPLESGSTAWVFNNATGAITQICTVASTDKTADLESMDGCGEELAIYGQLLAGEIRFNLRGNTKNLGTESVVKPVASGTVAWVINNSSKRIGRICTVSALTPTASLTEGAVSESALPSVCTSVSPVRIDLFAADDTTSAYELKAIDSENPDWVSIPATVELDESRTFSGIQDKTKMQCYSDAERNSKALTTSAPQRSIAYFCIIFPQSTEGWSARTKVVPLEFSDFAAKWKVEAAAGQYKVCRYTSASDGYTSNVDHPDVYGVESASCGGNCRKVTGNLVNQNFLVIDGTKSCPRDETAKPAEGDLVNSNTLQHQP